MSDNAIPIEIDDQDIETMMRNIMRAKMQQPSYDTSKHFETEEKIRAMLMVILQELSEKSKSGTFHSYQDIEEFLNNELVKKIFPDHANRPRPNKRQNMAS